MWARSASTAPVRKSLTFPARAGVASAFGVFDPLVKVPRFEQPFAVPPVLTPTATDATTDDYDVTQRTNGVELLPGLRTRIWGYNGMFPGPTIRARTNRRVMVRQVNALPEGVSVHLHGGVQPPESDGYPTDLIPRGARRSTCTPTSTARPRSSTTTTPWTRRAPTCTGDCPASTSWRTWSGTRCRCRRATTTCPSSSRIAASAPTAASPSGKTLPATSSPRPGTRSWSTASRGPASRSPPADTGCASSTLRPPPRIGSR